MQTILGNIIVHEEGPPAAITEFFETMNGLPDSPGDMLDDLEGEMHRVAAYIGVEVPDASWPRLVDACTFATVKKNPQVVTGDGFDFAFKGGADTFINKGTNGRWKDVLSEEELQLYHDAMARTLSPDCAKWLENGGPEKVKPIR